MGRLAAVAEEDWSGQGGSRMFAAQHPEVSVMKRRFGLAVAALLVAVAAVLGAAASAPAKSRSGNPFGIQIVRFAKGTPVAQMRADVANAGAQVVADLSNANALAVLPASSSFATSIASRPGVAVVFADRPAGSDRSDEGRGGGLAGSAPADGKKTSPVPDAWHDLPSFWNETNPEGVLQWDDNRMGVPAA